MPDPTSAARVIAWALAAALTWGAIDVAQVAVATGWQDLTGLAALVLSLYAALGLAAGASLAALARHVLPAGRRSDGSLVMLAWTAWGLLFCAAYTNIVHLPSITQPVTLAANAAMAVAAAVAWLALGDSAALTTVARSSVGATATAALVVTLAFVAAAGWHRADDGATTGDTEGLPGVFVIVVDTLRFDRTGLAGDGSSTPVLDALIRQGTSFERAYAQASWTKPSAASLFTSLYPSTHGANLRRDRLSSEPTTLPELFADAGYRTAVFSANPWISPAFGFDRGVQTFFESERESFARLVMLMRMLKAADRALPGKPVSAVLRALETAYGVREPHRTNCRRDSAIVEELDRWLGADDGRPAFAYFHLMSPHIPYQPPGVEHDFAAADQVALLQQTSALPAERLELLLSLYDATVAHGDRVLGDILASIERHASSRETIVIVTTDHGEEFYEHGRWGHGKSLYDEVVHVPMVVRGPGFEAGALVDTPAMLVDVMPTLAAAIGRAAEPSWEGADLRRLPAGRAAYGELIREGGFESYMVYDDGAKYLETVAGLGQPTLRELYDIAADGDEQSNLATTTGGGDRGLGAELTRLRTDSAAKRVDNEQVSIDAAAQQKLEALGYVN